VYAVSREQSYPSAQGDMDIDGHAPKRHRWCFAVRRELYERTGYGELPGSRGAVLLAAGRKDIFGLERHRCVNGPPKSTNRNVLGQGLAGLSYKIGRPC
jgi:hypothetical protein